MYKDIPQFVIEALRNAAVVSNNKVAQEALNELRESQEDRNSRLLTERVKGTPCTKTYRYGLY